MSTFSACGALKTACGVVLRRGHVHMSGNWGQSIEGLSSLKIMFIHSLIRKSGNGSWIRRCGTKTDVLTSLSGVGAAPKSTNLK
jgi:hypothetical protein